MKRYATPPTSPPRIYLSRIPKGYLGTKRTVEHMQTLIRQGVKDFCVRQKAIDILLEKGVRPKDYLGEIKALFEWVQRNVRYTKDPFRLEVLHTPRRMLELRAGDCDDMSILLGAMLEAIGHPVRLVLTGPNPLRPRLFTHIYLEVHYHGRWIPLDPTMPYPMGWAHRTRVKKVVSIERKPKMVAQNGNLQGLAAGSTAPMWLPGFIRTVRSQAVKPKDPRVKLLWGLLRRRKLLGRSRWLRRMLRYIWRRGLAARPRPRMTRRMVRLFRRWAILPPRRMRRMPAVRLRDPLRSSKLQPVRPARLRPLTATAAVRPLGAAAERP